MNRLLDQLKQGLRRIGRGRLEVPGGVPTGSPGNDRGQDTRLRTELDDAPSSLDKRLTPTTPPAGPQSGRTRKAILSKARRTAPSQNALSFWGLAPVSSADKSGDLATIAPASMLAGSSLLQPSTAAAGARRDWRTWGAAYRAFDRWRDRGDLTDYDGEVAYVRQWLAARGASCAHSHTSPR